MQYQIRKIEEIARQKWAQQEAYRTENDFSKPKYYILDMFPYPSGAGLHVGHPLGYVASDIMARYKKMKGYQVLHPMGFDSFGLPAEQYAIETGQHPKDTTVKNVETYKKQLQNIGLSFDWSREVWTSDPQYFKWTQWIFLELFKCYYNTKEQKAKPIEELIAHFEVHGTYQSPSNSESNITFDAQTWNQYSEKEKSDILLNYRLAFVDFAEVNWCEALGTVLANDEVTNGRSERGNHPVEKRKMRQWFLRISAYADRLLQNLETIDFSPSLKEMQRNWIGKSTGASVHFEIEGQPETLTVFTTRPDTIFGATFMVLAPEHPLVEQICTDEQRTAIENYLIKTKSKSDIDRQSEKEVSGCFTGAFAIHPFSGNKLPIYIADYVLMGYGTGAIMAVPAEDDRDHRFATKFGLDIIEIYDKTGIESASTGDKKGTLIHSASFDGMDYQNAHEAILNQLAARGIGTKKTQFRLRDANFSRQRYWGEPIPILWKNDIPYPLSTDQLPLINPEVDSFLPSSEGKSPLSRNTAWVNEVEGYQRETDTMPGYAGSSWYFLRYMNPTCDTQFIDEASANYWNQVDLYIGGTEHAVGHLMYSRFWNMFLYDRGYINFEEPYKKMINQGMIQGRTNFVYRSNEDLSVFVSKNLADSYPGGCTAIRVDVNKVENDELNIEAFKAWRKEYETATFVLEEGKYICGWEVEKMSKSKYNVVNPDDVIEKHGADTFRMYEMFLGPVEMSKPWNTAGIEGVSKFLRRFWNLYFDEQGAKKLIAGEGSADELKTLHKTILKVSDDIEKFSYNTSVSAFMIAVNEFQTLKTNKESVLLPFAQLLAPFAPHTVEAIWTAYKGEELAIHSEFPIADPSLLVESAIEYPVSINGKMRTKITLGVDANAAEAETAAMQDEIVLKWIDGQPIKKFIFVPKRMINIVL